MSAWLSPALFHARPVLGALGIGASALGAGWLLLRRFPMASWPERLACALGAGFGCLSYAVFALGLAHRLTRPALVLVWAAGLAAGAIALWLARRERRSVRWQTLVPALVAATLLALPVVLQPLYPPGDSDATAYHLAASAEYLEAHALPATPYLRYPVFPQFQEMLFTLALGLFQDVTAHFVSFLMWLGAALALVAWGRREGDRDAGLLAAALWIAGPTGLLLASNAYVDAALAFYAALVVLAWCAFAAEGRMRWAGLAGAMAGVAASIKYAGLFFVAAFALATWLHAPRGRRTRSAAVFLVAAIAACLPWYARNVALAGDPLFPFLGGLFANPWWSADDLARQVGDLRAHGAGRAWIDFLRVWDRLGYQQGLYVGPEDLFSPAFWIPLPLLLALRWRHARERTSLFVALAFVIVWFAFSQSGRYLLPIVPILCLASGRAMAGLLRNLTAGRARAPIVWAAAALLALPGPWYAWSRIQARGWPPASATQRNAYLARVYPSYPAYDWLNRTRGASYRVYAWRDSPLAYYAEGQFRGDWFGPARYAQVESALTDATALHERLQRLGVGYFLVPNTLGPVRVPADGPFASHFRLVYPGPGARVYAVLPETAAVADRSGAARPIDLSGSPPR